MLAVVAVVARLDVVVVVETLAGAAFDAARCDAAADGVAGSGLLRTTKNAATTTATSPAAIAIGTTGERFFAFAAG